jgi:hypothetical protein
MTGVIWLVQILVYPNFRLIPHSEFQSFHHFHTNRITWVVAPVMGVEMISGAWLCFTQTTAVYVCNFTSILILWILTAGVSVPCHNHLSRNPEASKAKLIGSNWPRTGLWSLRSIFWLWWLQKQLGGDLF